MNRHQRLLSAGEVAKRFAVSRQTVSRWARSGALEATRTAGGHARFRESDVQALIEQRPERRTLDFGGDQIPFTVTRRDGVARVEMTHEAFCEMAATLYAAIDALKAFGAQAGWAVDPVRAA
jgi:excisionase family DNA binding protein